MSAPYGDDPLLWLEEVQGARALDWVRARNAESTQELESMPGYEGMRRAIRSILDSKQQIPHVSRRGAFFYNLWRDAEHPRGLWRRTTLAEYRKAEPAWETVLDLDALGRAEAENWVWSGVSWLAPAYRHAIVALSRGGADARVLREFDVVDKRFVGGGFTLAEGKSSATWIDHDTLWLEGDLGPDTLTDSGYPRTVRRWKRGSKPQDAAVVFEVQRADVGCGVAVDHTPGFERTLFERTIDFYRSEAFLLEAGDTLLKLAKPEDASVSFWRDRLLVSLRSDWAVGGRSWPSGSLLAADARAYLAGERRFTAVFTPTPTRSLQGWTLTRDALVLQLLDNVAGALEACVPPPSPPAAAAASARDADPPPWPRHRLATPPQGNLSATALHDPLIADDPLAHALFVNYADFLTPDSLLLADTAASRMETLKSRPRFFDASGMRIEQRQARSRDGTAVPYFVVWPPGAKAGQPRPVLLDGYGGFEVPMLPVYSGARGGQWMVRGGVFVLANIRGGGEFGPAWHQAALREKRQNAFDDFIAVAEDLMAAKITTPAQLGILGGSNGGLLVGAVMLQRPELFKAVCCQVPLLDMKRYHRLLAGASWMAEYGNPDVPEDWAFISRYSPYQRVLEVKARLPRVLFVTSTRDDRVHPGHARKMAQRMRELGHDVLYWENIEGGHGAAADNEQAARMWALQYAFLWRELAGGIAGAAGGTAAA